jgi:hypothetical protein
LERRTNDGAGDTAEVAERFTYKVVKASHPVFTLGEPCPVPNIVGVPLVIFSPTINGGMSEPNGVSNQVQFISGLRRLTASRRVCEHARIC